MVASSRITLDIKAVKTTQRSIDEIEQIVIETANDAIDFANDRNLPSIRSYPYNDAISPFRFTTEKSRRYYFGVIVPRNGGGRYIRTRSLQNSWQVDRTKGRGVYRARLYSSKSWALFVVGNIAQRRQVPGHRNTGWELIAPKIEMWQSDVLSQFFRLYDKRVGSLEGVSIR